MDSSRLCAAIRSMQLVSLYYTGDELVGYRTVEPHMVAYNKKDELILSAWYIGGAKDSQDGQGWRHYLLSEISSVTVLDKQFSGPRPGYRQDGGRTFHRVQCAL